MKAVHFGAGNIGPGFVGLLLHEGGYELVFSDVSAPLVEAINAARIAGQSEAEIRELVQALHAQRAAGAPKLLEAA